MRILIVEQERLLADALKRLLEAKGFSAEAVYTVNDGARYAMQGIYDLMVLDVEGIKILRHMRERSRTVPTIILAAQCEVEDRINGMNAGADYYLEKPFDSGELIACINCLLRRQSNQSEGLTYGNTSLDLENCMLVCGGKTVRLSAREFDVMRFMFQSRNKVIPKETILARVWGYDSNAAENHVEVYVGFLRKKLVSIGSNVRIVALRRLGYQLQLENEQEKAPSNRM